MNKNNDHIAKTHKEDENADFKQHNEQILAWIEALNQGKGSKSGPRNTLEEQIQVISHSYKNAQEKLLNLEKQLYFESIHSEKQRSIIEILKYIINDNLDDDTILVYLSNMEE